MAVRLTFNPTDSPVVIDPAGHEVAGQDWAAVDDTTPQVQAAAAAGRLVWPAKPAKNAHPRALAAQARVDEQSKTAQTEE